MQGILQEQAEAVARRTDGRKETKTIAIETVKLDVRQTNAGTQSHEGTARR